MGKLLSIQVAEPQPLQYRGRMVMSAIGKRPVLGAVMVRRLNIDGDRQADLRVHGGVDKAVYAYPSEHYAAWEQELGRELPYGTFGENLTLSGLLEDDVRVGDRLQIGGVLLEVTQPRVPCFKLGTIMGDMRFLRRFLNSGRSGFYFKVLQEGLIEAGDEVVVLARDEEQPTIREWTRQLSRAN